MVTSPGGTTAAALAMFEEGRFAEVVQDAVGAAYQRARELG
jgi:pyrroline-5-carboxylate reductase